jgi:hypothetical protein
MVNLLGVIIFFPFLACMKGMNSLILINLTPKEKHHQTTPNFAVEKSNVEIHTRLN